MLDVPFRAAQPMGISAFRGLAAIAWPDRLLILFIVMVFAIRAWLVTRLNVNWDEFYYLSKLYSHDRGELAGHFQTFQVHLLGWLTEIGGDEIDQIFAGRAIMLLLSAATCLLIYLIGRLHFSRSVALLCVLCYLSFGEVLRHGASFRVDPLYAPLVLAAIYSAMAPSRRLVIPVLGGAAAALALMFTIKAAIFFPAIGALFLVRLAQEGFSRNWLWRVIAFGAALLVAWLALYGLHDLLIGPVSMGADIGLLQRSYAKTLSHGDFFLRWPGALRSLIDGRVTWLVVIAGLVMTVSGILRRRDRTRWRDLDLICLAWPLVLLLFYRNAFPYFYVLVLSFLVIPGGAALAWLEGRFDNLKERRTILSLAGSVLIVVFLFGQFRPHAVDETEGQRELLATVHETFPEPVPYIDRCSMVSSFPKVGFFMSTWGLEVYREAGLPLMRGLIESRQPKFLIANTPVLDISQPYEESGFSDVYRLLPDDYQTLRENFIPHWGPLFVAGKKIAFARSGETQQIEVLIGGTYTVERAGIVIDGAALRAGDKVKLNKGRHRMMATEAPSVVVLRWGDNLFRPDRDPPLSLFTGL